MSRRTKATSRGSLPKRGISGDLSSKYSRMGRDSKRTNPSSRITGTPPRGFICKNSGAFMCPWENSISRDSYSSPLISAPRRTRQENGLPLPQKISSAIVFSSPLVFRSAAERRAVFGDERVGGLRGRASDLPDDAGLDVEVASLVSLCHAREILDLVWRPELRQGLRPGSYWQIDVLDRLAEHTPKGRRQLRHGE